jgi:type IV pilus assembly protein PilC
MAQYQYQGVDRAGKRVQGKVEAATETELRMLLRGQGVRPTRISRAGALDTDIGALLRGGKTAGIRAAELSLFTRQLQVLIAAGIPLVQALDVLGEQTPNATLKRVIITVKTKVSQGAFLWESLAEYSKSFPKIYISLIRAGESSGALDKMLERLAKYLERADQLSRQIKSAMMYPVLVTLVGVGVVGGMLIFVIPKFESFLTQAGQELPGPTKLVIDASHFLQANFLYIAGALVAGGIMLKRYYGTKEGKAFFDAMLFRLPLFGILMQKAGVARFTRTMGTLLSSGVSLLDAIDICRTTLNNAVLERAMVNIRKEVEGGRTLGAVLGKVAIFPKMAQQMIAIGESTGNLEKMLDRIADIYEADVETLVGGMSKLIEPIVLVFLGGSVGGILIAMYLPIFKLAGGAG